MAKAIMIQGTMSDAGKSLIAAGLCRIFRQDGYRAVPFKAQNMALNSYITKEGLEMGRAQVVQAQAAGVEPEAAMNPVLLKPSNDTGSQVIVNGIPVGTMSAREYFRYRKELVPVIKKAYDSLAEKADIVVIEGAGSPAEINLKQDDIVNMGMARLAQAPVLLVGDIDRGGVFAQLYGTVELLESSERAMIKGLVINKFRGDPSILMPGVEMIEKLCRIPAVGVVPYMSLDIEDEDSLSGRLDVEESGGALLDIAVIRFPRLSNFTDFNALSRRRGVGVRYVKNADKLGSPDLVILPGTKNTIDDLLWMRQNGLESSVKKLASRNIPVFGICGGYQMMGRRLVDESGAESGVPGKEIAGMGFFPLLTRFEPEKTRTRVTGVFGQVGGALSALSGVEAEGYEIHMGVTQPEDSGEKYDGAGMPLLDLAGQADGYSCGNLYGTYVHGVFDRDPVADAVIDSLIREKGGDPELLKTEGMDFAAYREAQFDKLAAGLRGSMDRKKIYEILDKGLE